MVSRWFALLSSTLLVSCGTVQHWREVRSGPVTQAEVFDAIDYLARSDGFAPSISECDRGLGVWVSRWRLRQMGLGHPGRYRLHAEILLDEGNSKDGWIVRFLVEQQRVKNLSKSLDPVEDDWSDAGQDAEREYIFGKKLTMRLGTGAATGREPDAADPSRKR